MQTGQSELSINLLTSVDLSVLSIINQLPYFPDTGGAIFSPGTYCYTFMDDDRRQHNT